MTFDSLKVMLADVAQPQMAENPLARTINSVGLMVMLFVVMYVVLLRPQQKKAKELAKMIQTVKNGDKIVTSSGIIGVVITVKEKTITFRSADTKLEITKGAIAEITERGGETAVS